MRDSTEIIEHKNVPKCSKWLRWRVLVVSTHTNQLLKKLKVHLYCYGRYISFNEHIRCRVAACILVFSHSFHRSCDFLRTLFVHRKTLIICRVENVIRVLTKIMILSNKEKTTLRNRRDMPLDLQHTRVLYSRISECLQNPSQSCFHES